MNISNNLKLTILILFCFTTINLTYSNNISISNISLSKKNTVLKLVYVHFNISWDNSWKINSGPQNWDAAWVFIKFRVNGGVWKHATLNTVDNNHIVPAAATIDASSDGKGVFLYRTDYGSGTFTLNDVQLLWQYGSDAVADDAQNLEIKVFGIEMVYVNQGPFYVGDGVSLGRLWNASDVNTNPALISTNPIVLKCEDTSLDDAQLEGTGILVDGDNGIDMDGISSLDNTEFPTGYRAFYCMKHEITNEQFAQFLNTLTRIQQNAHCYRSILGTTVTYPFPINVSGQIEARNCVRYINPGGGTVDPVYFFCDLNNNAVPNEVNDGQNVGMAHLGWVGGAAYADWAGLRPMTELEFEKACRGPEIPVSGEFAWHTTNYYGTYTAASGYQMINTGEPNEYPQNPGTGIYANAAFMYTTGHLDNVIPYNDPPPFPNRFDAPVRTGIFATSTSDRINAGASYYGIMELSGGMADRCVTLGRIEGRVFRGTNGDGYLTESSLSPGYATNIDWPGITSQPENGIIVRTGSGFKGGDWNDAPERLRVSDRFYAAEDYFYMPNNPTRGNPGSGFRCVRSAD